MFDVVVDLADDVALEASNSPSFRESFGGAAFDVGQYRLVALHPDDDGAIDRGVELAVASVVDAVASAGLARPGWDGADAGKSGEGGLGADAFGVVADDDEDLCGDLDALLTQEFAGRLDRTVRCLSMNATINGVWGRVPTRRKPPRP